MREDESLVKKFEKDMGFSSCSISEEEPTEDNEFLGRGKERIVFNCINYKNEDYKCKMVIESEQNKIIKSNCEEIK